MIILISIAIILWSAAGFIGVVGLTKKNFKHIGTLNIFRKALIVFIAGPLSWFIIVFLLSISKK